MTLRGFAHLKPLPGHLMSRTLALCRDDLPSQGPLPPKRASRAVGRDVLGAQLEQEQIRHDCYRHRPPPCGAKLLDSIKVCRVSWPNAPRVMEVPMPSYEEVIQRAGSLRAMTGLTQREVTALLPHFEPAPPLQGHMFFCQSEKLGVFPKDCTPRQVLITVRWSFF
jgi:hypothetical protein